MVAVMLYVPIKVYKEIKEYKKPKATRDSIFRIVENVEGNIYIQFSNDGKNFYRYSDTCYYEFGSAMCDLDRVVEKLNRSEKILHEYNPIVAKDDEGDFR